MEKLYGQFQDQIEFFTFYVQEAHPMDGWQTDSNVAEGVVVRQHPSFDEREEAARPAALACTSPFQRWEKRWITPFMRPTARHQNAFT